MPSKYPCIVCTRSVRSNSLAVCCDICDKWCHISCGTAISREDYITLVEKADNFAWTCTKCTQYDDNSEAPSLSSDMLMSDIRESEPTPKRRRVDSENIASPPPGFAALRERLAT